MQKEEAIRRLPLGTTQRPHPLPGPHLGPKCSWQRLPGSGTAIQVLLGTGGSHIAGFPLFQGAEIGEEGRKQEGPERGAVQKLKVAMDLCQPGHEPGATQGRDPVGHQGDGGPVTPGKGPRNLSSGKPGSSRVSPPRKVSMGGAELWGGVALRGGGGPTSCTGGRGAALQVGAGWGLTPPFSGGRQSHPPKLENGQFLGA